MSSNRLTRRANNSQSDITAKDVFDSLGVSKAINTVDKSLFVNPEEPEKLDILVRTSDVKRLSDFMMWQASAFQRNIDRC